ncbi:MAG: type II toxin-antitoxin system Phd/YefM family antitoxin [Nesterenkonia sp.]
METILHPELRNSSSKILARVASGETIAVTNHGRTVAILSPPHDSRTELDRVRASGNVRPANPNVKLTDTRRTEGVSSKEVLDDLRGSR